VIDTAHIADARHDEKVRRAAEMQADWQTEDTDDNEDGAA